MLHVIIMKFPKSIVDNHSRIFFVNLVTCLVNDHDNKVRSMTGASLKLLVGRVSPYSLQVFLDDTITWYVGGNQKIWSAAAQVIFRIFLKNTSICLLISFNQCD